MPDTVKINLTIIDPSLSDEELQSQVQFLLPQIREVEGVETVALTKINLPDGTKAGGNFLVGSFYATVNILKRN